MNKKAIILVPILLMLAGCGSREAVEAWGHEHFGWWSVICIMWGVFIGQMGARK